ncbi:hypothetical protein CPC08DRAFT_726861 [Agrocybe pediades]|nr:hypothetical protein CPC08DRAFT_726861 [Agrocybe pediades]
MFTGSSSHIISARPTKRQQADTTKLDNMASAPRAPMRFSLDSIRIERGSRNVMASRESLYRRHGHCRGRPNSTPTKRDDSQNESSLASPLPRPFKLHNNTSKKLRVKRNLRSIHTARRRRLEGSKKLFKQHEGRTSTANLEAYEEIRRNAQRVTMTWFRSKQPAASVPSISLLNMYSTYAARFFFLFLEINVIQILFLGHNSKSSFPANQAKIWARAMVNPTHSRVWYTAANTTDASSCLYPALVDCRLSSLFTVPLVFEYMGSAVHPGPPSRQLLVLYATR